jgi:ABC-type amino acid transport substrate-binding protein
MKTKHRPFTQKLLLFASVLLAVASAILHIFPGTGMAMDEVGTVKVGILTFPPYSINIDGKPPEGAIVEIIRATFAHAGLRSHISIMPYSRAIKDAEKGKIHAVGILNTQTSSNLTLSAQHTVALQQTFFVKNTNPWNYTGIQSLNALKVLTVRDYNYSNVSAEYQHYLETAPNVSETYGDDNYLLRIAKMIKMGRVDVFNEASVVMNYSLQLNGLSGQLREAGTFQKKLYLHVGFANTAEGEKYRKQFDASFATLLESGDIEKILDKYGALR